MPNHVIVASDAVGTPPRYFLGYKHTWHVSEGLWTPNPWLACWVEADEATVEIALLAMLYPNCRLQAWPVNAVGTPETR